MSRNPIAILLAVVSAILIVFGRINHDIWWGNWVFVAGIAVLVAATAFGVTCLIRDGGSNRPATGPGEARQQRRQRTGAGDGCHLSGEPLSARVPRDYP